MFRCAISVGVVFGVRLEDDVRVAVKAQSRALDVETLLVVTSAQTRLADAGFPCPRPLVRPAPLCATLATAETWHDGSRGDFDDAAVVFSSAHAYAEHVRFLRANVDALPSTIAGQQWPPRPHNVLFDFSRDAEGAAWIDAIALRARERLAVGEAVVGHSDWSSKHVRFDADRVVATYDWDSLRRGREPVLVGFAAGCHHVELDSAHPWRAEPDRVRAYVAAYERARGPFSPAEMDAALAAAVYLFAYTARCEHGYVGPDGPAVTRMRETLAAAAADLSGGA